jgi:hypothetical protein
MEIIAGKQTRKDESKEVTVVPLSKAKTKSMERSTEMITGAFPPRLIKRAAEAVKSHAVIKIGEPNDIGDITISVKWKELGFSKQDLNHPSFKSAFFLDMLGELLVRKHIGEFADILAKMDTSTYANTVNSWRHTTFGFEHLKDELQFSFHLSLAQSILAEEFIELFRKTEASAQSAT